MDFRNCIECGEKLSGRADKKFCGDQCRNAHHNRQNRDDIAVIRNINHTLRKNRRILSELNVKKKTPIKRLKLAESGFNFQYCTECFTSGTGKTYWFCYNQGFFALDDDTLMLVERDKG